MKKILLSLFMVLATIVNYSFAEDKLDEKQKRIKEISENINIGFENSKNSKFIFNEKESINYEIIYFFSYGCPHCYSFKDQMKEWNRNIKDDVSVHFIPVTFQKGWENLAKGYLIAKDLKLNNFDDTIFNHIHVQRKGIKNIVELRNFFVENYNVNTAVFNSVYNSIDMNVKIESLNKITDHFDIMGTPNLLLITKRGNSYLTSPSIANGNLNMIFTIEYLMMKDRKLNKIKSPEILD